MTRDDHEVSDPLVQHPSRFARTAPDRPAVIVPGAGHSTYGALEERSNRVAQALRRRGLGVGAHAAIVMDNRLEFFEVAWGALRAGLYVTPINWHLSSGEVNYVVEDCGADALVVAATCGTVASALPDHVATAVRLAVGGTIPGFADYEEVLADAPADPVADECEGNWMFYSSGTTGRPKGIKPPATGAPLGAPSMFSALVGGLYGCSESSVYLNPAPLYHAAPAGWTTTEQRLGGTVVSMERFDPVECLALIEAHRVTHVQFVPTHLVRLLKLPEAERRRFNVSSLQVVVHAAAPCPPEVKRAAIEWLGPIVHEYYSGSEGIGFCAIDSEEWLAHPGSVGRSLLGPAHVVDESGNELAPGEIGQVWFESHTQFEYHGDREKTAAAFDDRGWSTLGDVGWLDDDGYLYLTDRVSSMIISGGVNIYPREVEDVVILHPAVDDVAAIGVPMPRWVSQFAPSSSSTLRRTTPRRSPPSSSTSAGPGSLTSSARRRSSSSTRSPASPTGSC